LNNLDFSLQNINAEQPSVWSIAYALLLAFALSSCIAMVYHITSPKKSAKGQFIQTLILGSIGASIIVLAIGDSLGRGLGILGALAFIRFRTTLRQQRDIVFVFCSLGIGMACGMYGFNIAVIGTLLLCTLALLFRLTPLNAMPITKKRIRISIPLHAAVKQTDLEVVFTKNKISCKLERAEYIDDAKINTQEFTYELPDATDTYALITQLKSLHESIYIRLWSRPESEND
jgi:uncharacterized membrane protein YhiD involved in acid resistance